MTTTDVDQKHQAADEQAVTPRPAVSATTCILAALLAAGIQTEREHPDDTDLSVVITSLSYRVTVDPRTGDLPSNALYVPWNKNQPHEGKVYPPLTEGHNAYYERCFLCNRELADGQPVQIFVWGPTTEEDRIKHWKGETYPALALICNEVCVQGQPEPTE